MTPVEKASRRVLRDARAWHRLDEESAAAWTARDLDVARAYLLAHRAGRAKRRLAQSVAALEKLVD